MILEPINENGTFCKIKKAASDSLLYCLLFSMAILIIYFNVKGYDNLFKDDPIFSWLPLSPIGLLLAVAEFAVLLWTSAVVGQWISTSKILKAIVMVLIPSFWFLCYTGINGYLSTLATSDIRQVEEVKTKVENNAVSLESMKKEERSLSNEITDLKEEAGSINQLISQKSAQIDSLSRQASERRLKVADCSAVKDCADSVAAFMDQMVLLRSDINALDRQRNMNAKVAEETQLRLFDVRKEIRTSENEDRKALNQHAGTESDYAMKKASYEKIVMTVAGWFGLKPEDPYGVFVSFISFLIYPVYFMLNLYFALNSTENRQRRNIRNKEREDKRNRKLERKKLLEDKIREKVSTRNELLRFIVKLLKIRLLRKKKSTLIKLTESVKAKHNRKSIRTNVYGKMIRYFRIWAHRRQKVKEVQVETIKEIEIPTEVEVEKLVEIEVPVEVEVERIVEVEVEVEKQVEVIREVPVEVRVEVPVEVDRIVEVEKEVPVYVERIKKVPEPVFIADPQIVIHERIIPVPADISGDELERILNAQPRLNTTARDSEKNVTVGGENKGRSESREDEAAKRNRGDEPEGEAA